MAYHRPNDGNQWYNPDPDKLKTRDDIDRYMRNYNEAMMLLDHVEADAVLPKIKGDNSKWFKKIDKEMRSKIQYNDLLGPNQWDSIRDLKDEEKVMTLSSVNDLVDNNFMTKHGNPGNGRYRPEDFTPNSAYVNVNMMAGIYGGNTVKVLLVHYHLSTMLSVCGAIMVMKMALLVMYQINTKQKQIKTTTVY